MSFAVAPKEARVAAFVGSGDEMTTPPARAVKKSVASADGDHESLARTKHITETAEIMFFDGDDFDLRPPRRRRYLGRFTQRVFIPRRPATHEQEDASGHERALGDDDVPDARDFEPAPAKPKGPLSIAPSLGAMRPALVCFALFFAASLTHWNLGRESPFSVNHRQIFDKLELWRLFTALFTHSGMDHLTANTPLFLIFGWFLHSYFGRWAFPVASLLVGAAANAATVWLYAADTDLVGASGMLYGMVAMWLVLYIAHDSDHKPAVRVMRAVAVSLILLFPTTFHKTTSYLAHAWGFVFGLGAGGLLAPFVRPAATPTAADGQDKNAEKKRASHEAAPKNLI